MQHVQLNVCDAADLVFLQRMENHSFINTVDEFRTEVATHDFHHSVAHRFIIAAAIRGHGLNQIRAQVRRHHQYGVFEVDTSALTVRQLSIVQHLKQDIEDVRVRLLDLIQQDDRVWFATHGFGQVTAFFVANIARRRAD